MYIKIGNFSALYSDIFSVPFLSPLLWGLQLLVYWPLEVVLQLTNVLSFFFFKKKSCFSVFHFEAQFSDLFFCNVRSAINPTQCLFHLRMVLISRSPFWVFFMSSKSLLTFWNIPNTEIITILIFLSANSDICIRSGLSSIS